jgi:hypothetical protein
VTLTVGAVHGHLAHGMPALVRAIDPASAHVLPLPASETPRAGEYAPAHQPLWHSAGRNSIRASPASTRVGPAYSTPLEDAPCSTPRPAASSYTPPGSPFDDACWPQDDSVMCVEPERSRSDQKLQSRGSGDGPSLSAWQVHAAADDSEVIPACPCMPLPEDSSAPPVRPARASDAPIQRSQLNSIMNGGMPAYSGEGDSCTTPRAEGEICTDNCVPTNVAEKKRRALLALPSPSKPSRAQSVIPSRVYAATSPPGSQGEGSSLGASPEPCTVARAGHVSAGLIREDTPPPTYVPALVGEMQSQSAASSEASLLPRAPNAEGPPLRMRGTARLSLALDASDGSSRFERSASPHNADVPLRLSAFHASIRSRGLLAGTSPSGYAYLHGATSAEAAYSSELSTQSQGMRSTERWQRGSSAELTPLDSGRPLPEWHTPDGKTPKLDWRSQLHGVPSPVPKLPGGASPAICEIDPCNEDSRACSEEAHSAMSGRGPLAPAGSSAAQSLQWRENAWTGSTWRSLPIDAGTSGASGRQPAVLCALPTDTPAGLLFGLLLPLALGWHVVVEDCGFGGHRADSKTEAAWLAACEHAPALHGLLMSAAHCDVFTRGAMAASGIDDVALPSFAAVRACAIFGPCLTPPVAQSFFASMQPCGLQCASMLLSVMQRAHDCGAAMPF